MNDQRDHRGLDSRIVLTREELYGSHVDDLLQRNRNLQGDVGQLTGQGKWYYRNWFVFMVTGLVAAFISWALIEPYFDDNLYLQGPIKRMSVQTEVPRTLRGGMDGVDFASQTQGWVEINDIKVYISVEAVLYQKDGPDGIAILDHLEIGQEVGVWIDEELLEFAGLAYAGFVRSDPEPNPPDKELTTLEDLQARSTTAAFLLFPLVAGLIGLGIGAVDGVICRAPQRALFGGLVGLLVGFLGGFVATFLAGMAYVPLHETAQGILWKEDGGITASGLVLQTVSRGIAWALAGLTMGLGQGISQRSSQLATFGLVGGLVGGLIGGLLFDPIDFLISGLDHPSAHVSRMVGLCVIGAGVGLAIGLVEMMARGAWLRMVEGPLAGKEFLIFRNMMTVGSSPRSDLYLFNDSEVAEQHAILRWVGQRGEIESLRPGSPVLVNGHRVTRQQLRARDRIEIGRTVFIFEQRANQ